MKKIWLTLAGSLLLSMAVIAQERTDTTGTSDPSSNYRRTDTESGTQAETSTIEGKSATQGQAEDQQMSWRDEDRESISSEDLPTELLETLKSEEYQGWENATIYRNKVSEDYMLVIQDNGSTRTFYFDKEGQARSYRDDDQSSMQNQSGQTMETDVQTDSDIQSSSSTTESDSDTGVSSDVSSSETQTDTETQTSQENPGNNATGATSTSAGTTTPSGTSGSTLETETTISTEQPSTSWRAEDRVVIVSSDIPASLRVTLEDDTYRGWENSTIYRNRETNEYMIEIRDGSNSRIYYFDKDGKALQISGPDDDQ